MHPDQPHVHRHEAGPAAGAPPGARVPRIGIGGPVGSGKTALVAALCRALVRLLRSVIPEAGPVTPWTLGAGSAPHHPLVLGAGVALAGGTPDLAARAAALAACAGPASAAVRLLGLDPFAVQAMLARLAPGVDECAADAAAAAAGPASLLPADAAPALDLLADYHLTAEVRLFAS